MLAIILLIFLIFFMSPQPIVAQSEVTGGVLIVTAGLDDPVIISCLEGQVKINRRDPDSGPASCATITSITVIGSAGTNKIDLSGVTHASFPRLSGVTVDGGAGADVITASEFRDTLNGGPGDDTLVGTQADDRVETSSGQTWFRDAPLLLGPGSSGPTGLQSIEPGQPPEPLAPGLDTSFEGFDIFTGGGFLPPDPITAAGPNHVVSVVNVAIEWRTKTGASATSQTLANFFSSLSPATATFDPKVIYDQYAGRFVAVTLERVQSGSNPDPGNISRILVAVSDDSDPNGTWYFQAIDAKVDISGTEYWTDYPGLAIDEEAVYVTANMFTFSPADSFGGTRLWVLNKTSPGGGLYGGGTSTVSIHDPVAEAGVLFEYFTIQPAHTFGSVPAGVGTWLVSYAGITDGTNEYVGVIQIDAPLGTPSFSNQFVNMGDIEANSGGVIPSPLPDAPQAGGAADVETNDRRTLNAVWRDNSLWTTFEMVPASGPDADQVTAYWLKVDTTSLASLAVSDQGQIGGEDIASGTYTFFPSIAVDGCGNMGLGFAASAPTIFPGAYYTARFANDPAGMVQSSETLVAGLSSYELLDSSGRNRWGDYTGTVLDPATETGFWIYNEYALAINDRWGTRYGTFPSGLDFGDLPAGYSLTGAVDNGPRHCLSSLVLGSNADADGDGQESAASDGDDTDGSADEDGVTVTGNWTDGTGHVDVTVAGGAGCLSGWLDYWDGTSIGADNDFNDTGEQIVVDRPVSSGVTSFSFALPVGAAFNQTWYARFRLAPDIDSDSVCTDQTAIPLTGPASGGEVEDYEWSFMAQPPLSVSISAPQHGSTPLGFDFEALVNPISTTLPLTYTWLATEQTPVTTTQPGLTDTVVFTWRNGGRTVVTITAQNLAGSVTGTHVFTPGILHFPVIIKN